MTLYELLMLLRKHLALCIILPILAASATAAYAWMVMPNTYSASVTMYVKNTDSSDAAAALVSSISSSNLSASQQLTNDVATIIKSEKVKKDTAKALGMTSLSGFTYSVTSSDDTRVITLKIGGTEQDMVAQVANEMVKNTSIVAQSVMGIESVNAIDAAETPTGPSGPNRLMYTAVAAAAGLVVAIAIVVLIDSLNRKVRTPEEIEALLELPVIGRVPTMK